MVGIVIVSHSSKVAEGAREIAIQMAGGGVEIAACGGDKEGGIGTDPDALAIAVESVFSDEGVVILADLGSAVMAAEIVVEALDPVKRGKVRIANAPIVEGAVLAAVDSSMGKGLDEVLAAAEQAVHMPKVQRAR